MVLGLSLSCRMISEALHIKMVSVRRLSRLRQELVAINSTPFVYLEAAKPFKICLNGIIYDHVHRFFLQDVVNHTLIVSP
jgi:hypothetical protein